MSDASQQVRIQGRLIVDTDMSSNDQNKGSIYFANKANGDFLGGMRFFGTPQAKLIIDASGGANGVAVRATKDEGLTSMGGTGKAYGFQVTATSTEVSTQLNIADSSVFQQGLESGLSLLRVTRIGTTNADSLLNPFYRYVAKFYQTNMKTNETCYVSFGNPNFLLLLGWNNETVKKRFIAVSSSEYSEPIKALEFDSTGGLNVPVKLTATTIEATNWIGLPPAPTPDLTPITLDNINNRVGINHPSPTHTLQVGGDVQVDGGLAASTLDATSGTIHSLNASSIPPLSLDSTNHRVGINITPTEALHVSGNGLFTGTIQTNQNYRIQNNAVLTATTLGSGVVNSSLTSVGVLNGVTVNGNIVGYNAAQTAVGYQLGYPIPAWFIHYATSDDKFYIGPCDSSGTADFTKGLDIARDTGHVNVKSQLTANTINATTYLNLPPANVSPLVLDAANTRVGVGVTPLYTIDADVGTVKSGKNVIGDATSTSGIQHVRNDPENSVDMPPGSIVMHQNGSVWRKNTGNTSTGWRPLSIPVPTSSFRSTNLVLSGSNTLQNVASIAVADDGNPRTWMVTAYLVISAVSGTPVSDYILWGIQSANNSLAAAATSSVNKLKTISKFGQIGSTGTTMLYDSMTVIFHNSTGLTNIYLNAQAASSQFAQLQYTTQCGIVLVPLN